MVNQRLCSKAHLYITGELEDEAWNPIKQIT